ncbi:hypothetical protein CGC20_3775 [Leishmania donovani]|uniref:Uncharacterized protein n=1 Tax=Leishmania donovani TaxID=5661 RepID=A0A504X1J7_LEIDO|nr:hypothetical protein CGC20_3775 [Leishmania donovani]
MATVPQQVPLSNTNRRAQREWVLKIKETSNMLYRSAAQAQRNFDQYLTAMEYVGALYKDYGELLSAAQNSFLNVQPDVEGVDDVKNICSRLHISIHRWEHSEELYAVRNQLHQQTQMLKARSDHSSRVLQECVQRDELIKMHTEKSALLATNLRKQSSEVDKLQKECDKLHRKIAKRSEVAQKNLDSMAVKSMAAILSLTSQFFKVMHKNGAFIADRFSPDRAGVGEHDLDTASDGPVTGTLRRLHSVRSEMSSVAPSAVYGQNYNTFHPSEADTRVSDGARNSGIPLRYETNVPPAISSSEAVASVDYATVPRRRHQGAEAKSRYDAHFQRCLEAIAAAHKSTSAVLPRHLTEVKAGTRIDVRTSVPRFTPLVCTVSGAPQCKGLAKLLTARIEDAGMARAVSSGMALVGLVRTCNGRGRAIIQLVRDETASSLPAVTFSNGNDHVKDASKDIPAAFPPLATPDAARRQESAGFARDFILRGATAKDEKSK